MPGLRLSADLALPLEAVTETFGIFGQKGSGKSSTAALFVEQGVKAGGRFVIADPTGVWWGLMHDGSGPGLPGIVFGGDHADVPLEKTAGHVVADFVVHQDEYPVVVLDLKLLRKADRTSFMLAFLETLYHENREALHIVLDESWQFAPTQAREGGDQIRLLGAVEDVIALGRSRGLGATMISQRFATLNANVREQIGTLVAHRLVGALDRKALKGWIEAQADPAREKEVMEGMAKLKMAEALVWSPAFLTFLGVVHMDAPQTFDSRATPKVGQTVKKPGKRATVDLALLKERMAATIEEQKAKDPALLQKRVRDLERQLAERPAETVTERIEVQVPVEIPAVDGDTVRLLHEIVGELRDVAEATGALRAVADQIDAALRSVSERPRAEQVERREVARAGEARPNVAPARRPAPPTAEDIPHLKAGARRILETLARHHPMRMTRAQLGTLAKFKVTGGTFQTYWSLLKRLQYVDESGGEISLTDAGLDYVGHVPADPQTTEELLEVWRGALKAGARKMLDELVAIHPDGMTKTDLADRVEMTEAGGTFQTYLGTLRRNGLAEVDGGYVRASDTLFLGARA